VTVNIQQDPNLIYLFIYIVAMLFFVFNLFFMKSYVRNSAFTVSIWIIVHRFYLYSFSMHFCEFLDFNNEISFDEF
jgi:hypothetical protein